MKDKLCALCGGVLMERVEMLVRNLTDKGTVLIENVPARVCQECGHRWLSQEIIKKLERLAEGEEEPAEVRQVPVFSLT